MAETLVSDIIQPELFLPYVVQRSAQLARMVQSGIVDNDPAFAALADGGGSQVTMPFWNDLAGEDQVLSDTGALITKKITTSADSAVIHNRGDAWSTNDLAGYLAGEDPMLRIADLVADYWARKTQALVIATLEGIFASPLMAASNVHDIAASGSAGITPATTLTAASFIDSKQLLGDVADKLTAVAIHSAVYSALLKTNLITFEAQSEQGRPIQRFLGLDVVVDDTLPVEMVGGAPVFHTYLFGRGAIAMGVGAKNERLEGGAGNSTWQLEFSRQALAGQNVMINRRRFVCHPRGVKFLGTAVAGLSPTNAELANGANWLRVYDPKNTRMVMVRHNVLA